jgi:hypothetical protein
MESDVHWPGCGNKLLGMLIVFVEKFAISYFSVC